MLLSSFSAASQNSQPTAEAAAAITGPVQTITQRWRDAVRTQGIKHADSSYNKVKIGNRALKKMIRFRSLALSSPSTAQCPLCRRVGGRQFDKLLHFRSSCMNPQLQGMKTQASDDVIHKIKTFLEKNRSPS
jgi:hypothetical protein